MRPFVPGCRLRLVDAARVFRQKIAGQCVRAGARSAAEMTELARATFSVQVVRVAQRAEQGRVPIHVNERIMPHVTGGKGEEAARKNFTRVRDKNESFAVVDAGLALDDLEWGSGAGAAAFGLAPLCDVPPVVLSLRGLYVEGGLLGELVEEGKNFFVFFGADVLRNGGAAGGY